MRNTLELVVQHGGDECIPWPGRMGKDGYGLAAVDGRYVVAHRAVYEREVGPIPEGLVLDHVRERGCALRSCVNVRHLDPVTQQVNVHRQRGADLGYDPAVECPSGHARVPGVQCKPCNAAAQRRRRERLLVSA